MLASSFIYTVSSILIQFMGLIFVKINTNILSTEEYGFYSLLLTMQAIAGIFVSLGINSGYTRFFYEYDDFNHLRNNALSFAFIFSLIIFGSGLLISKAIINFILKDDPKAFEHFIILLVNSILTSYISIFLVTFKMQFKAFKLSFWEILVAIIKLLFLVILGWYLRMGITGLLLAGFLSHLIVFLSLFLKDIKNFSFVIDLESLKKMISYSGGLLLGSISSWILTFIDRYFLASYIGFASVGLYSVGYRIGSIFNPLFKEPFKKVLMPFQLKVFKDVEGRKKIKKFFKYYCSIGWIVIFFFSVYGKIIIRIIANEKYIEAYKIIPLVAFSYFLFGLTLFYAFGFHVANKMFINSTVIIIGAFINIILNILLVPSLGIIGAALATIGAYFIINIIYFFWARKFYNTELDFLYPYKLGSLFILFYGIYFYFISNLLNVVNEFLFASLLVIIYSSSFFLLGIIKKSDILKIKNFFFQSITTKSKNLFK